MYEVGIVKQTAKGERSTIEILFACIFGLMYDTECTLANMKWLPKITRWRIGLFGALFCRLDVFLALNWLLKPIPEQWSFCVRITTILIPYALFSFYFFFIFFMFSSLVPYSFTPYPSVAHRVGVNTYSCFKLHTILLLYRNSNINPKRIRQI